MAARSVRLSTRLAIAHGVLVALLLIVLAVTLQGLLRMLGLVVEIRDQRLSSLDTEEELHRSAWRIDVAMRHGRASCAADPTNATARESMQKASDALAEVVRLRADAAPPGLRSAVLKYVSLAERSLVGDTCTFLLSDPADRERALLDEELTNVWIDRLHELHADIRVKEERARKIGSTTAFAGLGIAIVAAVGAIVVARSTSRSVSGPVTLLAASATRIGEGDFSPIPPVEGPREIQELWRDLERARERLKELDNLKQNFVASVSHEMRSPLASVREALALLADGTCGELTPKQRQVIALASRACEREVRIVEALLDLSRFQSGVPLKRESACDVDQVLAAVAEGERDQAVERGVTIEVVHDEPMPPAQLDTALVERAIANLVRNAVSVSKRGQSVRITRAVHEVNGTRSIRVDVIDEGPGLAESLRASLFRPFAAAAVRGVDRPAGIGLGLSFAREVARAHGGDLEVLQSDGRGTTFRLELPIQPRSVF